MVTKILKRCLQGDPDTCSLKVLSLSYVANEISVQKEQDRTVYFTVFTLNPPNSKANTKFGKYILLMSLWGKHWSTGFQCGCQVFFRSIAFEASFTHSLYVGVLQQIQHVTDEAAETLYKEPPACKLLPLLGSFNRPKCFSWK